MTEQQFTETENTDMAEKSEDNISDSLNIAGMEDITVSNQLFVNSQN